MMVDRDRSLRNKSIHQDKSLRWVGPHGPALLLQLKCGNMVETIWNFDYPTAAKLFKTATDALGPSGLTMYPTRRSGARIDRVGFQHCARSAKTRSVAPLSPSPAPQAGNTRATSRGIVDMATSGPPGHRRTTGEYLLDVFGGSGFLSKATNHLGLRCHVLDTKFGPRYDVTQSLVLTRIRHDVSAGKCVEGMVFSSTTTQLVLFHSYFRQCCHR